MLFRSIEELWRCSEYLLRSELGRLDLAWDGSQLACRVDLGLDAALASLLDRGSEPQTLKEVGTALGVTKERVRQIEAKALEKLREAAAAESALPELE